MSDFSYGGQPNSQMAPQGRSERIWRAFELSRPQVVLTVGECSTPITRDDRITERRRRISICLQFHTLADRPFAISKGAQNVDGDDNDLSQKSRSQTQCVIISGLMVS